MSVSEQELQEWDKWEKQWLQNTYAKCISIVPCKDCKRTDCPYE